MAAKTSPPFRMPVPVQIAGRLSSVTNSFVNSIIPVVQPTEEEVRQALDILEMTPDSIRCAYCGDISTEWDHFRSIVRLRRPTGYFSDIRNLVPACGKCNQSKGNQHWKTWMTGPAAKSPASRGVTDLMERVRRLEAFERWGGHAAESFETLVGKAAWQEHWDNLTLIEQLMRKADAHARTLRQTISAAAGRGEGKNEKSTSSANVASLADKQIALDERTRMNSTCNG